MDKKVIDKKTCTYMYVLRCSFPSLGSQRQVLYSMLTGSADAKKKGLKARTEIAGKDAEGGQVLFSLVWGGRVAKPKLPISVG